MATTHGGYSFVVVAIVREHDKPEARVCGADRFIVYRAFAVSVDSTVLRIVDRVGIRPASQTSSAVGWMALLAAATS
jgi:hypothetical protein